MTPNGWLLLAAITPVAVIIAVYPVGALLFIIAIIPPARTTPDTPLRAALKPAISESSRRAAVAATVRWIRAYTTTSHGWRRVQVAINAGIAPASLASARWRRRTILLTTPHASLRVLQRRNGSWHLDDVAAWPISAGHAQPLLTRVCAAADAAAVIVTLKASTPKVAASVYAPLGFRTQTKGKQMIRTPGAPNGARGRSAAGGHPSAGVTLPLNGGRSRRTL